MTAPPPKAKPKAKAPAKPHPAAAGTTRGDSVYFRHPKRGAIAATVTAKGPMGFRAKCDAGGKYQVPWDHYLGHRARVQHAYDLVEHGEDGALVRDAAGRGRFIAGMKAPEPEPAPPPPEPEPAPSPPPPPDDPILDGMDRLQLKKASSMDFPDGRFILLKAAGPAAALANRPGLQLQRVTDRAGHQTQRWKKTGMEDAANDRRPMQHGEVVAFRHNNVQGSGKIVASGPRGVTVHDGEREHHVDHEHLIHPDDDGQKQGQAEPEKAPQATPAAGAGGEGTPPGDQGKAQPQKAPDAAQGAGGGGGGSIPPDQFHAADFFSQADKPELATVEAVLSNFPPDTAQKMDAVLAKCAAVTDTQSKFKKDGQYTPERQALHQKIIDHILTDALIENAKPPEGQKPTFTILGGRGGSGKSWFKGQVYDPAKAVVMDADEIKGMLPEYQGWNACEVHEESGDLFDQITAMAMDLGLNIVHDATMKTPAKAVALVKGFADAGYQTEAHYMHLPRHEAAKRAVGRFLGPTGRFVPPDIILGNTKNEAAFDQVKNLVGKWSFRDNSNSDGTGPKLISESGSNGGNEGNSGGAGGQDGRDGRPAAEPRNGGGGAGPDRAGNRGAAGPGAGAQADQPLRKAHGAGEAAAGPRIVLIGVKGAPGRFIVATHLPPKKR